VREPTEPAIRASLRTPRAAAIAGIAFSLLLASTLVLIRWAVPSGEEPESDWLSDPDKRGAVTLALNLVPFAGIAFLWFMGVIRDRIGEREDRFFATVFLGSGLLFVGMLFVAAAAAGGLLADPAIEAGGTPEPALWDLEQRITFTLLNGYAIRMGAVFIIATTTLGERTGVIPRWLAVAGFAGAFVLLFGATVSSWVNLVMPVWAFALSIDILVRRRAFERGGRAVASRS
jgi:MFS family permease